MGVRRTNSHSYLMSDFARLAAAHSQSIFANGVSIFQRRRSERFDSHNRAATGGKTAKREVLPGFCKIKHSSSSGGTVADATTVAVLPVKHMPWWPCHKIIIQSAILLPGFIAFLNNQVKPTLFLSCKGGLILGSFSFWLHHPKKCAKFLS